jgi:CDP-6-deoxy-D-xylo-4-hexulose-3-dehydrase
MQASVGCAQLEKLEGFIKARRQNWSFYRENLSHLQDKLILPEQTDKSEPGWFGFMMTVREDAGFTRNELSEYLESKGIQTRNLFAGNILRHPCFMDIRDDRSAYRVIGELNNTDTILDRSFWIGVYPGLTPEMKEYVVDTLSNFVK